MSFRDLLRVLDSIAELDILSDDHDGAPPDPTTSRRWFAALPAL
jgi:hypothetical protein